MKFDLAPISHEAQCTVYISSTTSLLYRKACAAPAHHKLTYSIKVEYTELAICVFVQSI